MEHTFFLAFFNFLLFGLEYYEMDKPLEGLGPAVFRAAFDEGGIRTKQFFPHH